MKTIRRKCPPQPHYIYTPEERNPYYDSVKFVLIVLVVIAHVLEPAKNFEGFTVLTVYNWINMFHMPLFVFISGRFSAIKEKKRYIKGIVRLLETYIVFQIIWRLYALINGTEVSIEDWLTPYYVLWYLLSLVLWRLLIFYISERVNEVPIVWIVISLVLSLLVGFIPNGTILSIHRTLNFLPFFVAGYCTRKLDIRILVNRVPPILSVMVLLLTAILIIPIEEKIDLNLLQGDALVVLGERVVFKIMAICMCIAVLSIVPNNKLFAEWGKQTILIYIYHAFATYALFILFKESVLPTGFLWLIIYSIIIISALLVLSKFKILKMILNPISTIIEKRNSSVSS